MKIRPDKRRGDWILDHGTKGGKRKRERFPSLSEAREAMDKARKDAVEIGKEWAKLPARERLEVAKVLKEMREAKTALADVWAFWREHGGKPRASVSIQTAIEQCEESKRQANRRADYIKGLRGYLDRFGRAVGGDTSIASIEADDIRKYLAKLPGIMHRKTSLGRINTLFSFARRQRWVSENPCDALEKITTDLKPPVIFTVGQCESLMAFIRDKYPHGLAWFALALFAGMRPDEAQKTTWEEIDLIAGAVKVAAQTSKTRRRRIIELQPAAVRWLTLANGKNATLPLAVQSKRMYQDLVKREMKLPQWPKDVLRHSFCSYAVASFGARWTAEQAGHSESILFRHYREVVSKEAAAKFWAL